MTYIAGGKKALQFKLQKVKKKPANSLKGKPLPHVKGLIYSEHIK